MHGSTVHVFQPSVCGGEEEVKSRCARLTLKRYYTIAIHTFLNDKKISSTCHPRYSHASQQMTTIYIDISPPPIVGGWPFSRSLSMLDLGRLWRPSAVTTINVRHYPAVGAQVKRHRKHPPSGRLTTDAPRSCASKPVQNMYALRISLWPFLGERL